MSNLVLFFKTGRGRQPVREYFDRVGRSAGTGELAIIQRHVDLLVEFGDELLSFGKLAKPLVGGGGICQLTIGDHRVAYAKHAGSFVLLHAWRKQARRSPRDVEKAKRRMKDWQTRHPDTS